MVHMINISFLPSYYRNISIYESMSGVVLAVLVCVVTALLLNIGFYKNFWVFTLCYVVGGAHFSLLKVRQ